MGYDRYDTREEGSRWRDEDDNRGRRFGGEDDHRMGRRGPDERGFFERAGDEISSWFGDEDAERRRRQDRMMDERSGPGGHERHRHQHHDRERGEWMGRDRDDDRSWNDNRNAFGGGFGSRSPSGDFGPSRQPGRWGSDDRERFRDRGRDYRPMAGDYGRGGMSSGYDRSETPYGRDDYRRTSFAGSADRWSQQDEDPHYHAWKRRHMDDLDRDYDDYRREHQSKFESDFGNWREQRQAKRGLLSQIREHMEVVGSDDKHVGTVDRIAGDRIILTKSDADSGGAHHSLSCSDIDRIDGDRVILGCSADQARDRWRDESRSRALFEREDQGDMGPRILDRSFEGTYRR